MSFSAACRIFDCTSYIRLYVINSTVRHKFDCASYIRLYIINSIVYHKFDSCYCISSNITSSHTQFLSNQLLYFYLASHIQYHFIAYSILIESAALISECLNLFDHHYHWSSTQMTYHLDISIHLVIIKWSQTKIIQLDISKMGNPMIVLGSTNHRKKEIK